MFNSENLTLQWTRMMDRVQALRAARTRPATAFVQQPEPRTIGSFARGRQLSAGNFVFAGHLVQQPDTSIWDLPEPDPGFTEELHGFVWLDDLAAAGDAPARQRAQDWLSDWIDRYGNGRGPGWTPELTGRRLIRWINHALFVMLGRNDAAVTGPFYRSLAQQTIFLGRRWRASRPGLARFEALTGLIYAGLSLEGMEAHVEPAIKALAQECETQIGTEGGLPTRNPEDLLEVFTLLNWAAVALTETGRTPGKEHWQAIERIAPTLRTLRHSDGGLARFHGGGRGLEGRLDNALAASGIKTRQPDGLSMGYARLSAGANQRDCRRGPTTGQQGLGQWPCVHIGVRTDFGAAAADRELRLGREFWTGLAARRAGHAIAFNAGPVRTVQRPAGHRKPEQGMADRGTQGCARADEPGTRWHPFRGSA